MKTGIRRARRTVVFTVITVIAIVGLFALNMWLKYIGVEQTVYADMTPEGLYSLSDGMVKQCSFIDELPDDGKVLRITFCTDPDYLVKDTRLRSIYFMALKLRGLFPRLEVVTVNVQNDPTSVAAYRTTTLTQIESDDVIISYGTHYRITSADSYWVKASTSSSSSSSSSSGNKYFSFNGEYRLASLLMSVTSIKQPGAYFVTGHGEKIYDPENPTSQDSVDMAYFYDLIRERGMTPHVLNLSETDKIPDDCTMLIINDPKTDFSADTSRLDEFGYVSDTEKIERYLVRGTGSVMIAKDYRVSLPDLEQFLSEWGIEFSDTLLRDDTNSLADPDGANTSIIAEYDKDTDSYGYAVYRDFANIASAPRMVVSNTGYVKCSFDQGILVNEPGASNTTRTYTPFISSYDTAKEYTTDAEGSYLLTGEAGARALAALSVRSSLDNTTAETSFSYIFCAASADFLTSSLLGNSSYSNYEIVSSVVSNISRTDEFASIEIGGSSMNSPTYGGKQLTDTSMSTSPKEIYSPDGKTVVKTNAPMTSGPKATITALVIAVPVIICAAGVFVFIRRRFM